MDHLWFLRAFMVAIALVMLGLGLSLRLADFARAFTQRRAVLITLSLQLLVLPALSWLLILTLHLGPLLAVGLVILVVSPGGITANVYTHLFAGNVALSICLTAISTVMLVLALPLYANYTIAAFAVSDKVVPIEFGQMIGVLAIVLVPVAVGMWSRKRWPSLSTRLDKPVKVFGVCVLATLIVTALVREWDVLAKSFNEIGVAVLVFGIFATISGYCIARLVGIPRDDSIAISMQLGVRNTTIPLFVAINVLANFSLALPAAVYAILMHGIAILFGRVMAVKQSRDRPSVRHDPDVSS